MINGKMRLGWAGAAVATLMFMAGCGSKAEQPVELQGQISTANNGAIPAHATARISLIQHAAKGEERRIVVERTLHNIGKAPVHFDIQVSRALVTNRGTYGLSAEIMDRNGDIRWQTPVPQSITPLQGDTSAHLMLQPKEVAKADRKEHYRCDDGFNFDAVHKAKQVVLYLGHRQLSLAPTSAQARGPVSFDGPHGNRLALKGYQTTVVVDGSKHVGCR